MKKIVGLAMALLLGSVLFAQSIGMTPEEYEKYSAQSRGVEQKTVKFFQVPFGITYQQLLDIRGDKENFKSYSIHYPNKNDNYIVQHSSFCKAQGVGYKKAYTFFKDKLYIAEAILPYDSDKEKEIVGPIVKAFQNQSNIPVEKFKFYDDKPKLISSSNSGSQYLMATATHNGYQLNIIFSASYGLLGGMTYTLQISDLKTLNEANAHSEQATRDAEEYITNNTDW